MSVALRISPRDNVAVATEDITKGQAVDIDGTTIVARALIPCGHKIALVSIAAGEHVLKYGSPIGLATTPIAPGDHVHIHNVESTRGRGDRVASP